MTRFQQAQYTVPAGKIALLMGIELSVVGTSTVRLMATMDPKSLAITHNRLYIMQDLWGLKDESLVIDYRPPLIFPATTDIKVTPYLGTTVTVALKFRLADAV